MHGIVSNHGWQYSSYRFILLLPRGGGARATPAPPCTPLYYTILYYTIPYRTIPYHTIPYYAIRYDTIRGPAARSLVILVCLLLVCWLCCFALTVMCCLLFGAAAGSVCRSESREVVYAPVIFSAQRIINPCLFRLAQLLCVLLSNRIMISRKGGGGRKRLPERRPRENMVGVNMVLA